MEEKYSQTARWDSTIAWVERFEPKLAGLAPEFRDPVRQLFQGLCRWDYLLAHPAFMKNTPPIVISAAADPDQAAVVRVELPFRAPKTGVCLRFVLYLLTPQESRLEIWIDISGGRDCNLSLELWRFGDLNGYGISPDVGMIRHPAGFSAELDRVLRTAAPVLETHCEPFVSGMVQPQDFADLIEIRSDDFFREKIKGLIHSNVFDLLGRTLLCHAVLKRRVDRLRILLEAGADPGHVCPDESEMIPAADSLGYSPGPRCISPLHVLASQIIVEKSVFDEMLSMLISHGADLNQKGSAGTPLGAAVEIEWFEAVKSLLEAGARDIGWASPRPMNAQSAIHQMLATTLGRSIFSWRSP
jgi:hypothetical protein